MACSRLKMYLLQAICQRTNKCVLANGNEKIKKLPFDGHFDSDCVDITTIYEVSQPKRTTPEHLSL